MHKRAKTILVIAIATLLIAATALWLLWRWSGEEWAREYLVYKVEQATGRELAVGDLHIALGITPEISATDIAFANAPWGSRPTMLTLQRIDAELDLFALFTGTIRFTRLEISKPDVLFETDRNGKKNWIFRARKWWWQRLHRLPTLDLQDIVIESGSFVYRNGQRDWRQRLQVPRFAGRSSVAYGPLEFEGATWIEGMQYSVTGTAGPLRDLQSLGTPYPLDLTLTSENARLRLAGTATNLFETLSLQFHTSFASDNSAALAKGAGLEIANIGPVSISAQLTGSIPVTALAARDIDAAVGRSRLSGEIAIAGLEDKPKVTAVVNGPLFDLSEFLPPRPEATDAAAAARVFPDEPLPFDLLTSIDGEIDVNIDRLVTLTGTTLYAARVHASLRDALLTLAPIRAQFTPQTGTLAASLSIDATNRTAPPVIAAEVSGAAIPLSALLGQFGKTAGISGGDTSITAALNGHGYSVSEIMAGLDGKMKVLVEETELSTAALDFGADFLTNVIDLALPSEETGTTRVKCAVIRLPSLDGIVQIDRTIAIETDKVNIVGSGIIDLRTEKLTLFTRTQATRGLGLGLGKISNILKIDNTLADPTVSLSTRGALREALSLTIAGGSLIVEGLLGRSLRDRNPCQTALTRPLKNE